MVGLQAHTIILLLVMGIQLRSPIKQTLYWPIYSCPFYTFSINIYVTIYNYNELHIYAHIHMYTYIYTHIYMCVYVYMHVCIYRYVCIYLFDPLASVLKLLLTQKMLQLSGIH